MKNKIYSSSIIILFLGVFSYFNFIPNDDINDHIGNRLSKDVAFVHVKFKNSDKWVKGGVKTGFFNLFHTKKVMPREVFFLRNDFSGNADSMRFRFNYNKLQRHSDLGKGEKFDIKKHAPYFQYDSKPDVEIFGKVVSSFFRKYYQITVSAHPASIESADPDSHHEKSMLSHIHGHLCSPTEGCDIIR